MVKWMLECVDDPFAESSILSHMITVGATLWVHVSDVSEGIMVHDLTHPPSDPSTI